MGKSFLFNRLIHLFEAGILEKMTNAEYEKMFDSRRLEATDLKMLTGDNLEPLANLYAR